MLSRILTWQYIFKTSTEIGWAVVVAVVTVAAPIITGTAVDAVLADPKAYLMTLAAAVARPAAVAFMVALRAAVSRVIGA